MHSLFPLIATDALFLVLRMTGCSMIGQYAILLVYDWPICYFAGPWLVNMLFCWSIIGWRAILIVNDWLANDDTCSRPSLLSVASALLQEFQRFDRRGSFPSYGHPLIPRWKGDGMMIPGSNTKEASGCIKPCCDTSEALFPPDVAGFDESKESFGGYQGGRPWREEASNFEPDGRGDHSGGSVLEPRIFPFWWHFDTVFKEAWLRYRDACNVGRKYVGKVQIEPNSISGGSTNPRLFFLSSWDVIWDVSAVFAEGS